MQSITLKHNNILVMSCTTSQSIGSNTISAAVISNGTTVPMAVTPIDSTHFNVTLDTSLMSLGKNPFDIRIGNVNCDTIELNIVKNIA